MKYSKSGLALTEQFETCRLFPYRDIGGVWTDGYGNTHNVVPGIPITMEKALADLQRNIQSSEDEVNRCVEVELTQGEFDALVDFTFNCGAGNFEKSTLLKLVNRCDFEKAADEFEKWDHCHGVVVAGLLHRRIAEEECFNGN